MQMMIRGPMLLRSGPFGLSGNGQLHSDTKWSDGKLTAGSDECFQPFCELKHVKEEKASVELIY